MIPNLLADALAAHGGIEVWRKVHRLGLNVRIGGNILLTRLRSPAVRSLECSVAPDRVYLELKPYPRRGSVGVLDEQTVRIVTDGGEAVAERTFRTGHRGTYRPRLVWDDLDELYFLSYALWNYTTTPFLFLMPGFEIREGDPWSEQNGAVWRRLNVTFPDTIPTHSREQTFYFDDRALLRRLDYTADVFGSFARAAHYCHNHRQFNGLVMPTHRVVYPRLGSGRPFRLLKAMEGWVDDVGVEKKVVTG